MLDIDVKKEYTAIDIDVNICLRSFELMLQFSCSLDRVTTMPTIYDVATKAGVSPKTVSRVINNHPNVRAETRERVLAAITSLDFQPNVMAKGLRASSSNLIGFMTDEIATGPFAIDIIRGAQDASSEYGKTLLIVDTNGSSDIEKDVFAKMISWQVEGLIFATEYHRVFNPSADFHAVPSVLVDCYIVDRSLPSVVPDEVQGARAAMNILLRKGHRRIAFINGPERFPASWGRLQGYQEALAEYGIPFDPALVCRGDWWQESGYAHTKQLMRLTNPPTAIFCGNDWMAMGAYDALKEIGLVIPNDVAIVGFDNRDVIAAHMRPPLTTIALPYYEMGQWAVRYLIENAAVLPSPQPEQHTIECPVIERESA